MFFATFGTEIVGTAIAAEGWYMTPIGWQFALLIWGYCLAEFLSNDIVKVTMVRLIRQNGNNKHGV